MAKDKLPWFPLWVNDWLASTPIAMMTPAQEGAYIRLLCHQWASEDCSLPADDAVLASLSRLGSDWNNCSHFVRVKFEFCNRERTKIRNQRLYEVWQKQREISAERSEAGRKSGLSRRLRNEQKPNKRRTKVQQNTNIQSQISESDIREKIQSAELEPESSNEPAGAGSCRARLDVSESVAAVVAHYQKYRPRSRPGDEERKLIRDRLKDGYSVADLCDAIDGNYRSPYHCGINDSGDEYHALELILRNADKVSEFIAKKDAPIPAVTSIQTKRNAAAAESYLEKRKTIDGILG